MLHVIFFERDADYNNNEITTAHLLEWPKCRSLTTPKAQKLWSSSYCCCCCCC